MQLGCVFCGGIPRRRLATLGVAVGAGFVTVLATGGAPSPSAATSTSAQTVGQADAAGTVWLCRPGAAGDPCAASLQTTVVPASGARTVENPADDPASAFDCFYVYPTVSKQHADNANLTVQPAEIGAAVAQASPFSQVCRVWAPMYRQRTERSLLKGLGADPHADTVAYDSLLSAWRDYLARDNGGRPIIFIGHSQGAAMLIRLLASQVDPDPALRARTVVATLAGGSVAVPIGKTVGATFEHLPLCTATSQTGCVIAYSSFPSEPPADADFGRPGEGVSLQSGQTATTGVAVACVNPAAIGATGTLDPEFLAATSTPPPPPVTTPWVTYPDLYAASCQHAGGATWLKVGAQDVAGRPVVTEQLGPAWGYHLDDVNLALGNLLHDVKAEEGAYTAHR